MTAISNIEVPLPPLVEQNKILGKIDSISNEHEDFLNELDVQIDLFGKLRQAVLQEAIEGKLTVEWRTQNPALISRDDHASKLLEKIKAEKERLIKEGKIKKDKPLAPISDDEKPFDLPEGWVWCRLGELIHILSGDGLTSKEMAKGGEYPVFGGNGINGFHDKYNIAKKTIVIGRVGAQCGSIHVTPDKAWVTDNAFISFFSETFLYESWLEKLLIALNLRDRARETAQPVISGKRVYPIVTGFPPLAEQQAIVKRVDKFMTMINELEKQVSERKEQSEMLMQSVLREAFAKG
ncbi:MAG: restriction endonuclease subunit S [Candidatus Kuenenia sp.]|nr:restriction endonuclease subunit S [Candidatus Kuenenia sp.]